MQSSIHYPFYPLFGTIPQKGVGTKVRNNIFQQQKVRSLSFEFKTKFINCKWLTENIPYHTIFFPVEVIHASFQVYSFINTNVSKKKKKLSILFLHPSAAKYMQF